MMKIVGPVLGGRQMGWSKNLRLEASKLQSLVVSKTRGRKRDTVG